MKLWCNKNDIARLISKTIMIGSILLIFSGCSTLEQLATPYRENTGNSIVRISYLDAGGKGQEHVGTGFLYLNDKLVITCSHVLPRNVEDMELEMLASNQKLKAKVLLNDETSDIAILKIIDLSENSFLSKSNKEIYNGLEVLAFGYPNFIVGYDGLFCTGGVIAQELPQAIEISGRIFNFALADLTVSSGNSGGPLVDTNGAVIGIVNGVRYYQISSSDAPVTITLFTPIDVIDDIIMKNDILNML